jgi:SAM-dependent methyltransferase
MSISPGISPHESRGERADGDRPCPLAERPTPTDRLTAAPPPWDLRRCRETGFVYLANPPGQDAYREAFAWQDTFRAERRRRREREPVLSAASGAFKHVRHHWMRRDRVVSIARGIVLADAADPFRLVDVGCAAGKLLRRLVESLPESATRRILPVGIEISTDLAAQADDMLGRFGGHCLHAAGAEALAAMPPGSVRMVVLSCVLEHELRPLDLLRGCRGALVPGGKVIVKVPNYDSVGRRLRGPRWCGYRWPDHVNYFTAETLAGMADRAGLAVERMNLSDRWPLSDSLYAILSRPTGETADRRPAG